MEILRVTRNGDPKPWILVGNALSRVEDFIEGRTSGAYFRHQDGSITALSGNPPLYAEDISVVGPFEVNPRMTWRGVFRMVGFALTHMMPWSRKPTFPWDKK